MEIRTETDLGMSVPPVSSDIKEGVVPVQAPDHAHVAIIGEAPPTCIQTHTQGLPEALAS